MRDLVDKPFDDSADVEDVISAYRLILGRNPEAGGFNDFKALVADGLTVSRLFQTLINSAEYRQKFGQDNRVHAVDCGGYFVCVRESEKDFGQAIVTHKGWEPHIARELARLLKPGHTFVDIGANVGVMALLGAKSVGPKGRVIAVEPNPANLQLLYAGIVKNGFENVRVIPFAASDRVSIFSLDGGTSNTYLTQPEIGKDYVQSVILDQTLKDLDALHVVKIDIEGHEPFALAGFRELLARFKPWVLSEFNPRCLKEVSHQDPETCIADFFEQFQDVRVIEHSGKHMAFKSPEAVWRYWRDQNKEAVRTGHLPDGMLHFDILARAR